jgi:hypothetical protein
MKKLVLLSAMVVFGLVISGPRALVGQSASPADAPPTFNKEVVRIFQNNCQVCHHPGDIAPFSLMTYEEAQPWAERIRAVTQSGYMPPWKADDGCGEFQFEQKLTLEEIDTLARWADAGAPEGDPQDLPAPIEFPDEWRLGQPDVALELPTEFMPDPNGEDVYRCFTIPTNFTRDQWISAVDIQPGNRAIVHHVLLFIDRRGQSAALDEQDPGPGYSCFGGPGVEPANETEGVEFLLGGWAPGAQPLVAPENVALKVPAGARVVIQMHYRPNGQPETDRTKIGLYFPTKPVKKQFRTLPILNRNFTIPAGAERHRVTATFRIPSFIDFHGWLVAPHMHLLGTEMKVTAKPLNQPAQCLIDIKNWDFNWQGGYWFQAPVALPKNTVITVDAYYDNSANNPRNPNFPPQPVGWGERTVDEMCLVFLGFTVDAEQLGPNGESNLSEDAKQFLKAVEEQPAFCRPR